jgi:hypothetical protein
MTKAANTNAVVARIISVNGGAKPGQMAEQKSAT